MRNHEEYAWFGLGGNLGDVRSALERARVGLSSLGKDELLCSSLYFSEPWGMTDQPCFINQVVGLRPVKTLNEALEFIQSFEIAEGRERKVVWGPRSIDIDILLWPNQTRNDSELTVPHPRLHERRFVLEPWAELAPNLRVPVLEKTVQELLKSCTDSGWVRPAPH